MTPYKKPRVGKESASKNNVSSASTVVEKVAPVKTRARAQRNKAPLPDINKDFIRETNDEFVAKIDHRRKLPSLYGDKEEDAFAKFDLTTDESDPIMDFVAHTFRVLELARSGGAFTQEDFIRIAQKSSDDDPRKAEALTECMEDILYLTGGAEPVVDEGEEEQKASSFPKPFDFDDEDDEPQPMEEFNTDPPSVEHCKYVRYLMSMMSSTGVASIPREKSVEKGRAISTEKLMQKIDDLTHLKAASKHACDSDTEEESPDVY